MVQTTYSRWEFVRLGWYMRTLLRDSLSYSSKPDDLPDELRQFLELLSSLDLPTTLAASAPVEAVLDGLRKNLLSARVDAEARLRMAYQSIMPVVRRELGEPPVIVLQPAAVPTHLKEFPPDAS